MLSAGARDRRRSRCAELSVDKIRGAPALPWAGASAPARQARARLHSEGPGGTLAAVGARALRPRTGATQCGRSCRSRGRRRYQSDGAVGRLRRVVGWRFFGGSKRWLRRRREAGEDVGELASSGGDHEVDEQAALRVLQALVREEAGELDRPAAGVASATGTRAPEARWSAISKTGFRMMPRPASAQAVRTSPSSDSSGPATSKRRGPSGVTSVQTNSRAPG